MFRRATRPLRVHSYSFSSQLIVWVFVSNRVSQLHSENCWLFISAAGIFAFCIHTYFLRTGRAEFDTATSRLLLVAVLVISLAQAVVTLMVI